MSELFDEAIKQQKEIMKIALRNNIKLDTPRSSVLIDMDSKAILCGFCSKPITDPQYERYLICSADCEAKASQEIDEHEQGDWD